MENTIHRKGALTTVSLPVYHPNTIMADVHMGSSVRLVGAAVLALTFVQFACAWPQSQGMPRAQRHESRHEIDQLEQVWKDALVQRNVSAMDGLLADDYFAITPNGTVQSKDQTLASLRSGTVRIKTLEVSDRKVRFYGQTAIVTSRAELHGSNADGDLSGSYRYTRVYVRDAQGKWKIVSFEASRIREGNEHR